MFGIEGAMQCGFIASKAFGHRSTGCSTLKRIVWGARVHQHHRSIHASILFEARFHRNLRRHYKWSRVFGPEFLKTIGKKNQATNIIKLHVSYPILIHVYWCFVKKKEHENTRIDRCFLNLTKTATTTKRPI